MTTASLPVISDAGLARYLQQVHSFPMLSAEDEYMYGKALQEHNSKEAAHHLVTSHLRLVTKIAMDFKGYGLPVVELISEGNIGLMQAVKKFDPDKGFRLSTYAMWWIKASIQEYVLRSWSLVKMGTNAAQKKLFFNLRKVKQKITKADEKTLSQDNIQKIAKELNVSERDVVEMDQRMTASDYSLNGHISDDGEEEWIGFLADPSDSQEVVLADQQEHDSQKMLLEQAIAGLNEREQDIIRARRLKEDPTTLDVLSKKYDISRERIRQIEARALEKIQAAIIGAQQDVPAAS